MDTDRLKEQITQRLLTAVGEIQAAMDREGENATGKTRASIRVRDLGNGTIQLVGGGEGCAPIPSLEVGNDGKDVPQNFYYVLLQWTRDKGLSFETDSRRKTFAYFLSRKIQEEGTERYRENVDIYSSVARQAADEITELIKGELGRVVVGECLHDFDTPK